MAFQFEDKPSALFPMICAVLCASATLILSISKRSLPSLNLCALHKLHLPITIIAISFTYVACMIWFGFVLSTLLFVPAVAVILGYRKRAVTFVTTLAWSFGAYFVFVRFLKVPL